jgi:signal transduction histidine kinase
VLARECAALFEILFEEKSLRLVVDGDESAEVDGDDLFLRKALVNIIHNAVKYSPPDDVVSVHVASGRGERVFIEIQDNGPCIPAQDEPRVFERFYRVDKARWREWGEPV